MSGRAVMAPGIPSRVAVERAKSPLHAYLIRHQDEPDCSADPDGEYIEVRPEVVLIHRTTDGDDPRARIHIVDTAGAPWPYSDSWGEWLTPDAALRLADCLIAAARTMLNEEVPTHGS